jgi:hypothetical protein
MVVSAWLTHKENGALLVLNLVSNNLHAEGIELGAEALKGNQIMTELSASLRQRSHLGWEHAWGNVRR